MHQRVLAASGDEFHLVHIIKDETEKLREYYQEKSLGAPQYHIPALITCLQSLRPSIRLTFSRAHHLQEHCFDTFSPEPVTPLCCLRPKACQRFTAAECPACDVLLWVQSA